MVKPTTLKEHLNKSDKQKAKKEIEAGTYSPAQNSIDFILNYSKAVSAASSEMIGNVVTVLN